MKVRIGKKEKTVLLIIGTILAVLLSTIGILVCFSIKWMFNTWTNLSMDELMYHLTAPLEGTNEGMIQEYMNVCVAPTILILMIVVVLLLAYRKDKTKYLIVAIAAMSIAVVGSVVGIVITCNKLDVGGYVYGQSTYSTFIDDNYVDPANVALEFPEKKRNLIYIFLESIEMTYADKENGGAFDENVIPELTELAQSNEDFSGEDKELNGGYAMPGATWTIAAMFSQTSGIPLKISIEDNSMDTQDTFFAGAVTLGDILQQAGYSQTLMIGSDATFGGRRLYFTEHGNYNIYDYNYAVENGWLPEDYRVWWGYEDQRLFGFAKEKLTELSQQQEPFNLTMLTVDTHFEDGYSCQICPDTFVDNQYANVMACSSKQVKEFIEWIQQQDFYENTTIVISGDHPTMDSDFCENVDEQYERRVYTAYINADAELETHERRNYTTFDDFPTTLAAMGVKIDGDRLGLGTNLFSSMPTLTERFGIEKEERELARKSKMMDKLANIKPEESVKMVQQEQQEEQEIPSPAAEVEIGEYLYDSSLLPVYVRNIVNMSNDIQTVMIAIWKEPDQSDLQWIPMELWGDGTYYSDAYIGEYGENPGEYNIHVYAIDTDGNPFVLSELQTVIE